MKPLPKRAHGKDALVFRRSVAARLQLLAAVVGEKSEVAEIMGISRSRLSNWISPDKPLLPSIDPIIRLCDATGCTLDYVFRGVQGGLTSELAGRLREKQAELARSGWPHPELAAPPLKIVTRP